LKCYIHQNVDAVGVCTACGRGVCRRCAVRLGGRIYCKEDADKAFSRRTTPEAKQGPVRGVGVALGSIFAYLLGGIAALVGFLLIFSAMVSGDTGSGGLFTSLLDPNFSFLGSVQQYPSSTLTTLGIATLIFGFFGIAAGFYIWKPSRPGAVMAIAFGVIGLAAAFELSAVSVSALLIDAWFGLSAATIAMSFVGLVQLTRRPHKPLGALGKPGSGGSF